MLKITFISSIQNRRKEYYISRKCWKILCMSKSKYFFPVTTIAFSYNPHWKTLQDFLFTIKQLLWSWDCQQKKSVSLRWQVIQKNAVLRTLTRYMYTILAFTIKIRILCHIDKLIKFSINKHISLDDKYMNCYLFKLKKQLEEKKTFFCYLTKNMYFLEATGT